jgi:hypothetical protein
MKMGWKTITFFVVLAVAVVGGGLYFWMGRLPSRDQFFAFQSKCSDIGMEALSVQPKVTTFVSAISKDPASASGSDFKDRLRTLRAECESLRARAEALDAPPGCQTLKDLTVAEATDQCKAVDSLLSFTEHPAVDSINAVLEDEKLALKDADASQDEYWRLDRLIPR